ncbi:unnamed protein product [Cyprideis torosa]|uniref:Uncharacterized protein n=1 Tax=Cyprideis torosa TaxID=163714 RepID=A0A7R8ZQX4_9CRUS|nr:unnamed protein product [Cyprideis torosa]CAG0897437.1 unnamed protein product [Cyprideis torosa]
MHLEIQVALNFVIGYLYNKLPRRRVNIFGEELEKALRQKFDGHWYPETPLKGSGFRSLRTGEPVDAVLSVAAQLSGMNLDDIRENLPADMTVWIDPGDVSYRIGEKGAVKTLYSEKEEQNEEKRLDGEVTRTFNPEAQVFRPIVESLSGSLNSLSLSPNDPSSASPSPVPFSAQNASNCIPKQAPASTPMFTTAEFAQTKFGSTKLKTTSKRTNRMSPTEFSMYIKQRALMQNQQRQHSHHPRAMVPPSPPHTQLPPHSQVPHISAAAHSVANALLSATSGSVVSSRSLSPGDAFNHLCGTPPPSVFSGFPGERNRGSPPALNNIFADLLAASVAPPNGLFQAPPLNLPPPLGIGTSSGGNQIANGLQQALSATVTQPGGNITDMTALYQLLMAN